MNKAKGSKKYLFYRLCNKGKKLLIDELAGMAERNYEWGGLR